MGRPLPRSALISSTARRCAAVNGNGSCPMNASTRPGVSAPTTISWRMPTRIAFEHVPAHDHFELQSEQLVERQPATGPFLVGEGLRRVDGAEGRGAVHELELGPPCRRQRVKEGPRPAQRLPHPLTELPTGDARLLRRGIDGHDAPRPVPDQVDHGIRELTFAPVRVELAEEQGLGAHGQLARPPRLIEERDPQRARAVVDIELDERPALAGATGPHRVDAGQHQGLFTHAHARNLGLACPIDVAARVVRDEIEDGIDVEGGQGLGAFVADLVHLADRDLGQAGEHPAFELDCGGPRRWAHSMLTRNGYRG